MTIDLKPYYDAVISAEAEEQRIAHELDALFRQETDEATAQALEMQADLVKAQERAAEARSLYESMQKVNRPNDVAKNFVPVSSTQPEHSGDQTQSTVMKRGDFLALDAAARMKFILNGGTLTDDAE